MFYDLPNLPEYLMAWRWEQIEPYYRELELRPLHQSSAVSWLTDWSRLEASVNEAYQRLWVATTLDTNDQNAQQNFRTFLDEVYPHVQSAGQRMKQKLVSSNVLVPGFEIPLRNMVADIEIFKDPILPLFSKEFKLTNEYERIVGDQTVLWKNRETTLAQLEREYGHQERARRESAWRQASQRRLQDRLEINRLWSELLDLRVQIASQAGLPDYLAYRWKQLHRFDYTIENCIQFHNAIEQVVVPAVNQLNEKRRQALGVDSLRPWDLNVDLRNQPPLRPFQTVHELRQGVGVILRRINPLFENYLEVMHQEDALDLDNRKGKAPGGYCVEFAVCNRPFIFMNAVGIHSDIQVLLRRCGSAFRLFETTHLPFLLQRQVSMEIDEMACMGLELLASPYLSDPEAGFYTPQQAARASIEFLEDILRFWPYMAVVDAFQLWAYAHPAQAGLPSNCDACWNDLWDRFMPGVNWNGLEAAKMTGWQYKQHIFSDPLYYIEYGLAQLGAFQVWENSQQNQQQAVSAFRRALASGNTLPIPQIYAAAEIKFAFDAHTLGEAVALAMRNIAEMEALLIDD